MRALTNPWTDGTTHWAGPPPHLTEEETAFLISLVNLMLSKDSSSLDSHDFMKMYRYQIFKMHCGSAPVIVELTFIVFFLGSRHSAEYVSCVLSFSLQNRL